MINTEEGEKDLVEGVEETTAAKRSGRQPEKKADSGTHMQVYEIVTSKDPSWQSIIYELINSEQLNPWDIDISLLCKGYFDKIREIELDDFFASSKILLAASLLLRIKSEILLNRYIKEIDDLLFGRKDEEQEKFFEKIALDENELPILMPKSPLPRFKKVTLDELMTALDAAIKTESRRIDREIEKKQRERLAMVDIPKIRRANIKDRIRQLYAKILSAFKHPKHVSSLKLPYSHFTASNKDEKVACFLPLLHLSNNNKLWLEQNEHFGEIWIYIYQMFKKNFPEHDKDLLDIENEIKGDIKELTAEIKADRAEQNLEQMSAPLAEEFENPLKNLENVEEEGEEETPEEEEIDEGEEEDE